MDITGTFTTPNVTACGDIPSTLVDWLPGRAQVSGFSGPTGPKATATGVVFSSVDYGGTLTTGNEFGTCDIEIDGTFRERGAPPVGGAPGGGGAGGGGGGLGGLLFVFFQFLAGLFGGGRGGSSAPAQSGTFHYTSTVSIAPPNAPTFDPNPVTVPKGKPGAPVQVKVSVTPAGKYEIVCHPKGGVESGLFVQTIVYTDGSTGSGPCQVQDLLDQARGPITVHCTITPQAPCYGANPVEADFTVVVK